MTLDRDMARFAAGLARETGPAAVVLWEPPAADHAAAQRAGCIELDRGEYLDRLSVVEAQLRSEGREVFRCRATTIEVLAELLALGLANDPAGRAAAVVAIWAGSGGDATRGDGQ
ncbi:MAG: hypothetical protein IT348_09960 [Candidatus Eisenbacteria bacterium]|nr:hypothetical protein [Candidatus Eisenbacteria bacterium]